MNTPTWWHPTCLRAPVIPHLLTFPLMALQFNICSIPSPWMKSFLMTLLSTKLFLVAFHSTALASLIHPSATPSMTARSALKHPTCLRSLDEILLDDWQRTVSTGQYTRHGNTPLDDAPLDDSTPDQPPRWQLPCSSCRHSNYDLSFRPCPLVTGPLEHPGTTGYCSPMKLEPIFELLQRRDASSTAYIEKLWSIYEIHRVAWFPHGDWQLYCRHKARATKRNSTSLATFRIRAGNQVISGFSATYRQSRSRRIWSPRMSSGWLGGSVGRRPQG